MHYDQSACSSPVAIGGLGGSGTRVVAEILKRLGYYIGAELNRAFDNLWFTVLFRNPRRFAKSTNGKDMWILKGLSIFEKAMTGQLKPTLGELAFITRAAIEYEGFRRRYQVGKNQRVWSICTTMIRSKTVDLSSHIGWGWKEPNTHAYLQYLIKYFDRLRYIHVIRHGLDMAYSSNQNQLHHWGSSFFDVQIPASPQSLPKASLEYWTKANDAAIDLGKRCLGDRFLVVNFDELCSAPDRGVRRLVAFLELDDSIVDVDELCLVPKLPSSTGRYRQHNLSIFTREEIEAVRRLGFKVD